MFTNNSSASGTLEYTRVRCYVSAVSFSVLLFFNIIINSTIIRAERLRSHTRFVLVFHLLVSALLYMGTSCIFYLLMYLDEQPARSVCLAMVTVLICSGSNILLTLTAMALDRYRAVCHPLRYTVCASAWWPWVLGACTWIIALIIPLSLLFGSSTDSDSSNRCGQEQLRKGQPQKMFFLSACTLIILYSYVRIVVVTRRLGVLNRRNKTVCRTIALHGTQLAVYILPNFVSLILALLHSKMLIGLYTKELSAVVIFTFFNLAQCIAPVVYGLRKEEVKEELMSRFPGHLKRVLGWTVQTNWTPDCHRPRREQVLTAQTMLSMETLERPQAQTPDQTGPILQGPLSSCTS